MSYVQAADKDEVTHIRFGGFGSGSETWVKGAKLKPQQIKALKDLVKVAEGGITEAVKPENNIDLENMFD